MRAAIREQHVFEPRMRAEGHFERVVGGFGNETRLVWLDEEKQLISVHQPRIETQLHSRLPGKLPIRIDRRVEWIVRGRNVVRERGRGNLRLRPVVLLERVREFLAGKPDLPRKQAIRLESLPAVFCDGGGIDARE